VDLATALSDDLKDSDAAINVLKQAESAVKSNADFIKTAKAIQEIGKDDKEWVKAITFQLEKREEFKDLYADFIVRESECTTSFPMRILAGDVVEKTGDTYYGAKLYKQAQSLTINFNDFTKLAKNIHSDLKDNNWVKSIYTDLLGKCSSLSYYDELTSAIADTLKDEKWIREIYLDVEKKSQTKSDFVKLATIAVKKLDDKEMASELLGKARGKCTDLYDYCSVAGAALTWIDDREMANELYESAKGVCQTQKDYWYLLNQVKQYDSGSILLSTVLDSALEKLTSFNDLLFFAETAVSLLDDSSKAAEIYGMAEEKAISNGTLSMLGTSLKNRMDDSQWSSKVLRKIA